MQVNEIKAEGLVREFKVLVPANDVENKVVAKIQELAKTARVPGFRPGRAPVKLLRKKYGPSVIGEVLENAVNETAQKALAERDLRTAAKPKIDITSFDEGSDLEYTLTIELMPEVDLIDFSAIKLENMVVEVGDDDVQKSLERLADTYKTSAPIASKRKAKSGDVVMIDFVGRIDGEEFPGGKAEGYSLELGSGSFIPGFEDQLIGIAAGCDAKVKVDFPQTYGAAELAGKEAEFDVKVLEIHKTVPAPIDDELAKKTGQDNLDALKKRLKEDHEREYKGLARQHTKRDLLDKLAEAYSFDVPPGMLEDEFEGIWNQYKQAQHSGMDENSEDKDKTDEEKRHEFHQIAERRVRLGLVLGEVGRKSNIEVTPEEVNRAMMQEASRHQGQEREILQFLQKNPQAASQVAAPLFEEKAVDFIIEMAQVSDKKATVEDLLKEPEAAWKPAPLGENKEE